MDGFQQWASQLRMLMCWIVHFIERHSSLIFKAFLVMFSHWLALSRVSLERNVSEMSLQEIILIFSRHSTGMSGEGLSCGRQRHIEVSCVHLCEHLGVMFVGDQILTKSATFPLPIMFLQVRELDDGLHPTR